MLAASIAILTSTMTVRGTTYQPPVTHVDGNETMQLLGRSVVMMDLNGDHIGDLVVGAPFTSAYGLTSAGAVTIYVSAGGVPMANVIVMNGTHSEDLFGWTVANVSDVNGDGMSDLAVGSPLADPSGVADAGNVTIFYGWDSFDGSKPNVTIDSDEAGEEFGYSIAPAGDVMVDGMDDMIVGAPYYGVGAMAGAGRAYVFYGGNPMNSVPDKTFTGDVDGAHLGFSVAGGVNVDQDATLDMVAGAPDRGTAGATYIIRNLDKVNPTVNVVNGKAAGDRFGYSVAMVPDINGNTFGEIAAGAPYNDDNGYNAGEVSLIYGSSKFNTGVDLTLMGSPGELFGWAVAAGDFRQDGYSDILVGAPESRLNATSIGRTYAYFGASTPSTTPNITLVPDTGASFFGGSLAIGDNITGDRAVDFAVGDPSFNLPGIPTAGRVYVYAGERVATPPLNPMVQGYVYVPGTSVGLSGFTVSLESPTFNKSTTTNAAGYYQMTALPGTYWLNASRTGYVANSTYPLVLAMDDVKSEDFYPLKVPVITGTVRDAVSSNVIQAATVALYNGTSLASAVMTPANGTYWILLPEQYIPAEGAATDLTLKVWDATHYTNVTDFNVIRNETKFVNVTLDRFAVVSGTVRDAMDLSAVRGAIEANQGATIVATTTTDIRGHYTFIAVNASTTADLWVNITATGYFRTNDSLAVNKNGVYTLDFIVARDTVKPTSQVSSLPQYETAANFPVTATASDPNGNGIKEVQLWYRQVGPGPYANYASDTSSPYIFSFDTTTAGGDGTYEFYSIAIDYADNAEDAPASNDTWTYVDSIAPTLTITIPPQGLIMASSSVPVAWSGSDSGSGLAKFEVQLDSDGWVDKGLTTTHSFTSVADGPHTVYVRATDIGGLTTTKSADITVDTTSAVSLVGALPTYSTVSEFVLSVTAGDATGIQEVQLWFRYGGTGSFQYFGRDTASPWEFVFNASDLQDDGMYEFYSLAIDGARNNETPPAGNDTWTIVDTLSPTLSITQPTANQTVGSATVRVNWTGSDLGSGIASYRAKLDSGAWVDCGLNLYNLFPSVADGNHTVWVNATDRAGRSNVVSVVFAVDTVPPTVSISLPINDSAIKTLDITLRWTASDNGSGLVTVEVSLDGTSWEDVSVSSTEYIFSNVHGLVEGPHTISVRVADRGGLTSVASVDIILDKTPPTVTISRPSDGQKVGKSNVTITWAMADAGSGVARVQISVDGGTFVTIGTVRSYDVRDLVNGDHTVTIRVTDNAGNHKDVTVAFTVSIGGGISSVTVGAIAILVILVAVAAVLLMKRRKGPAKEPEKKGPVK